MVLELSESRHTGPLLSVTQYERIDMLGNGETLENLGCKAKDDY